MANGPLPTVGITAAFPLRGYHIQLPRGQKPPEYSEDLLNVWPADPGGRLRGGPRAGTAKWYASQVNGSEAIRALHQSVSIVDPSTTGSNSTTASNSDSFTALTNWTVKECNAGSSTASTRSGVSTAGSSAMQITSNRLAKGTFSNADGVACALHDTINMASLADSFIIDVIVNLVDGSDFGTADTPDGQMVNVNTHTLRIVARANRASYGANPADHTELLYLVFNRKFMACVAGENDNSVFGSITAGNTERGYLNWSSNSTSKAPGVKCYVFPTKLAAGRYNVQFHITKRSDGTYHGAGYIAPEGSTPVLTVENDNHNVYTSATQTVGLGMGADCTTEYFDDFRILSKSGGGALTTVTTRRQTNITAIAGANIYVGDTNGIALATDGTSQVLTTGGTNGIVDPQIASSRGVAYIVDGAQTVKTLNFTTKRVGVLVTGIYDDAVNGGEDKGDVPENCTLVTFWRDRLILAAPRDYPMNYHMSRQGVHDDFDYGMDDEGAAFAGNASPAHYIGKPITALMVFSDDELVIGGDSSMWRMSGDPTAGGSLDLITDTIGVVSGTSWCMAPDGSVYFVGTGGLYRLIPGGILPECLSRGKFDTLFTGINRNTHKVHMQWDRDNQGCSIWITARDGSASTHYWWDARTEGLFPWSFTTANINPMASTVFDGDGTTDRYMLLGTQNGYVIKIDKTAFRDHDGTAIASRALIGPFYPFGDDSAAVLMSAEVEMGELSSQSSANCAVKYMGSYDDQTVVSGSPRHSFTMTYSGTVAKGRRVRVLRRLYGGVFYVQLSNSTLDKSWAFERTSCTFSFAGRRRRY